MPANEFLLCIDIGGDSIKAAEFSYSPTGDMVLEKFAFSEYGKELNGEEDNFPVFATALSDIVSKSGFSAKKVSITISGQNSYIKFVKVPAMVNDEKKIKQIIEFEAKNAIPFSMDEVVWDSQLISSSDDSGEIEAMFVIVKNEEIDKITRILESLGKEIVLIEVAPTACYRLRNDSEYRRTLLHVDLYRQRPFLRPYHPDCRSFGHTPDQQGIRNLLQ